MQLQSITKSVYFPPTSTLCFIGACHIVDSHDNGRHVFIDIQYLRKHLVDNNLLSRGTKLYDWAKRFLDSSSSGLQGLSYMGVGGVRGKLNSKAAEIFMFVQYLMKQKVLTPHHVQCVLHLSDAALPRAVGDSSKACGKFNNPSIVALH